MATKSAQRQISQNNKNDFFYFVKFCALVLLWQKLIFATDPRLKYGTKNFGTEICESRFYLFCFYINIYE